MGYEAILFDFDGVILDSEILSNQLLADMLSEIGAPTSLAYSLDHYMGYNFRDIKETVELKCQIKLPADFITQFESRKVVLACEGISLVDGIEAFLAATEGVARAVASSSEVSWLEANLDKFGLLDHFRGEGQKLNLFSGADLPRSKPHPDIYLLAARRLGFAPEQCLVVEDSPIGIQAGKAAGMPVVGLLAGRHIRSQSVAEQKAAGADHQVETYQELLALWQDLRA